MSFVSECSKLSNQPANQLNTFTEESSSEIDSRSLIETISSSPPNESTIRYRIHKISSLEVIPSQCNPVNALSSSVFPVKTECKLLIFPMRARLPRYTLPALTSGDNDKLWTSLCNLTYPSVSLLLLLLQRGTWMSVKKMCHCCALSAMAYYLAHLIPPYRTA
jgi:hypothetical protein